MPRLLSVLLVGALACLLSATTVRAWHVQQAVNVTTALFSDSTRLAADRNGTLYIGVLNTPNVYCVPAGSSSAVLFRVVPFNVTNLVLDHSDRTLFIGGWWWNTSVLPWSFPPPEVQALFRVDTRSSDLKQGLLINIPQVPSSQWSQYEVYAGYPSAGMAISPYGALWLVSQFGLDWRDGGKPWNVLMQLTFANKSDANPTGLTVGATIGANTMMTNLDLIDSISFDRNGNLYLLDRTFGVQFLKAANLAYSLASASNVTVGKGLQYRSIYFGSQLGGWYFLTDNSTLAVVDNLLYVTNPMSPVGNGSVVVLDISVAATIIDYVNPYSYPFDGVQGIVPAADGSIFVSSNSSALGVQRLVYAPGQAGTPLLEMTGDHWLNYLPTNIQQTGQPPALALLATGELVVPSNGQLYVGRRDGSNMTSMGWISGVYDFRSFAVHPKLPLLYTLSTYEDEWSYMFRVNTSIRDDSPSFNGSVAIALPRLPAAAGNLSALYTGWKQLAFHPLDGHLWASAVNTNGTVVLVQFAFRDALDAAPTGLALTLNFSSDSEPLRRESGAYFDFSPQSGDMWLVLDTRELFHIAYADLQQALSTAGPDRLGAQPRFQNMSAHCGLAPMSTQLAGSASAYAVQVAPPAKGSKAEVLLLATTDENYSSALLACDPSAPLAAGANPLLVHAGQISAMVVAPPSSNNTAVSGAAQQPEQVQVLLGVPGPDYGPGGWVGLAEVTVQHNNPEETRSGKVQHRKTHARAGSRRQHKISRV